ncbi:MAG: substrate-binding domain-containing protein [Lachnospiraceae bacterium]|nr:substrate-binding domain-containing protein [Lachnospiraceae bacterium]
MNMDQNKIKKSNFTLILVATTLFVVVTSIIGIGFFRFYMNHFKETEDETRYQRYYALITEERKSSFWQSVYQGAYEAGVKENAYVEMLGSNLSTTYSREDLMRIAIDSGVDGIIVEADETKQMAELINEAVDAGIPVVTLYGDSTQSNRISFVGVGSYNLGREYGRQILQIAEEQEKDRVKVSVLVNSYTQNSSQNILCSGIQETVENANKSGTDIEITLVSVDNTNAFSVEESIRDIFMEDELPDIIICLNELNTTCVYQAVVDYNKVGQVNILGYYDSETIIKAIDRNVIYATVSVDTEQMGQFCIDALTEYYEYGNTSQYFTADIAFINKDNVSRYLGGGEDEE